jgi:7,8-dihydro-6-hydroxymethylpterin-pyrophosphokinase
MLDLLIAILIALGCNIESGTTADQLNAEYSKELEEAKIIYESGNYRTTDTGGIGSWDLCN